MRCEITLSNTLDENQDVVDETWHFLNQLVDELGPDAMSSDESEPEQPGVFRVKKRTWTTPLRLDSSLVCSSSCSKAASQRTKQYAIEWCSALPR